MSASTIAHDTASQQGWTDSTLLSAALDYIDNQQDDSAFQEFLDTLIQQEAEATGEAQHDAADEFASDLANQGTDAQIAFLKRAGAPRDAIAEVANEGSEALDEYVRDFTHEVASEAVNNNFGAMWVHAQLSRNFFIENIKNLCRKPKSVTDSDREVVKEYLRPRLGLITWASTPDLLRRVTETFPGEYAAVLAESLVERETRIHERPRADVMPDEDA